MKIYDGSKQTLRLCSPECLSNLPIHYSNYLPLCLQCKTVFWVLLLGPSMRAALLSYRSGSRFSRVYLSLFMQLYDNSSVSIYNTKFISFISCWNFFKTIIYFYCDLAYSIWLDFFHIFSKCLNKIILSNSCYKSQTTYDL